MRTSNDNAQHTKLLSEYKQKATQWIYTPLFPISIRSLSRSTYSVIRLFQHSPHTSLAIDNGAE